MQKLKKRLRLNGQILIHQIYNVYSESEDFRNVWKLAHEWAGYHYDKTDPDNLPQQIKLNLMRIASAILRHSLKVQTQNYPVLQDDSIFEFIFSFKHFFRLIRCRSGKFFNKQYLETLFVKRHNFIEWCELEKYPDPDFWVLVMSIDSSRVSKRPKNEAEDKAVCRAIAKIYWDIDSDIHPSHMVESTAICILGNGNQYTDNKTIKSWIADLDPQFKTRKSGRPKELIYKIDLKTGGLTQITM